MIPTAESFLQWRNTRERKIIAQANNMKITLNKALKLKKKMAGRIARLVQTIRENNSFQEGKQPPYDVSKLMIEYNKEVDKLIALKVAINNANEPIMDLITKIPELKSKIGWLNTLDVTEGQETYGYQNPMSIVKKAVINTMVQFTQDELEKIRDEIDHHNAVTEIEI